MGRASFGLLDRVSAALLGSWALAALILMVLGRFGPGTPGRWLDYGAWAVFGGTFLASYGARWLEEIKDDSPIGPLRLWSAAALVALLICMSSSLLVMPRWRELTAQVAPSEQALGRARSLAYQFLVFRMILAAALAWGIGRLPKGSSEPLGK